MSRSSAGYTFSVTSRCMCAWVCMCVTVLVCAVRSTSSDLYARVHALTFPTRPTTQPLIDQSAVGNCRRMQRDLPFAPMCACVTHFYALHLLWIAGCIFVAASDIPMRVVCAAGECLRAMILIAHRAMLNCEVSLPNRTKKKSTERTAYMIECSQVEYLRIA